MNATTEQQMIPHLAMAQTAALPSRARHKFVHDAEVSAYKLIKFFQNIGNLLLIALLSAITFFAISHFCLRSIKVVGVSMVPTLQAGGSYLLNVWAYNHHDPKRGDIVVIRDPGDHGLSVKRVIAAGGDSIMFEEGRVFVNGKMINEPYLLPHTYTFTNSSKHVQFIACGPDQYFVMGDNRSVSIDSRIYGTVSREGIYGLVEAKSK
jgi:signal peptidase I